MRQVRRRRLADRRLDARHIEPPRVHEVPQPFLKSSIELVGVRLGHALKVHSTIPRALDSALHSKRRRPGQREVIRSPRTVQDQCFRLGVLDVREGISADDDVIVDRADVRQKVGNAVDMFTPRALTLTLALD